MAVFNLVSFVGWWAGVLRFFGQAGAYAAKKWPL